MCVMTLTGCNIFVRDDYAYYSQIVASVDNMDFSMEDLELYFSLFNGQNYISQYNMSTEEAYRQVLSNMIDRRLITNALLNGDDFKELGIAGEEFDKAYKADIMTDVYEQINKDLKVYVDAILDERGQLVPDEEEEEDSEDEESTSIYEHTTKDEWNTNFRETTDDEGHWALGVVYDSYLPKEIVVPEFVFKCEDESVKSEAWSRYISYLQITANRHGRFGQTEAELFADRVQQQYEISREQKIIDVFQNYYKSTAKVNLAKYVATYKQKYEEAYSKYRNDTVNTTTNDNHYASYKSDMGGNPQDIYYHIDNAYTSVAHVLISFSTAQKQMITAWKNDNDYVTESATDEDKAKLQVYLEQLAGTNGENITCFYTDDNGKEATKSASAIYAEILDAVNPESRTLTLYDKADRFEPFVYKYSDNNGGSQNANFGFVVPVNPDDGNNNLVDQFANGARDLFEENPNGGNIKYVISEYGIHIIFSFGGVKNFVSHNQLDNVDAKLLWNTRVYPMTSKSILDVLAENDGSLDGSERLQDMLTDEKIKLKQAGKEITVYDYRLESLWNI